MKRTSKITSMSEALKENMKTFSANNEDGDDLPEVTEDEVENFWKEVQQHELNKDYSSNIKGLTKRMQENYSFDSFIPKSEEDRRNITLCKMFAEGILKTKASDPAKVLILTGRIGTGKTHLAVSIMKALPKITAGKSLYKTLYGDRWVQHYAKPNCLFLSFYSFIDELEDARNKGDKLRIMIEYSRNNMVVLDDLKLEDITTSVRRNLFKFIDDIYNSNARLIITTNATRSDIESYDERLADRLLEQGTGLKFTNPSFRNKNR